MYSGSATFTYESFMLTVLPFLIAQDVKNAKNAMICQRLLVWSLINVMHYNVCRVTLNTGNNLWGQLCTLVHQPYPKPRNGGTTRELGLPFFLACLLSMLAGVCFPIRILFAFSGFIFCHFVP